MQMAASEQFIADDVIPLVLLTCFGLSFKYLHYGLHKRVLTLITHSRNKFTLI